MRVLEGDEIGPSLRWATAKVTKASGQVGNGSGGTKRNGDAWATAAPSTCAASSRYDDEPPF